MKEEQMIDVEVAYALPDKQRIYGLSVSKGTTAMEAVKVSNVLKDFPDVNIEQSKMGIFGQNIKDPANHPLQAGDRVEVYRPLIADPKAARRKRAEKSQQTQ